MYSAQLNRIKVNTHIVKCMSPLGTMTATRLRMFPSFVNCCSIDWFTEWPEDALKGVGKGSLADYEDEYEILEHREKILEIFKTMHKSVEEISVKYVDEQRRHNYVTPTSYLELLNLYKVIIMDKMNDMKRLYKRYSSGLEKLKNAEEQVSELQQNLKDQEPKLKQAEEETKILLASLEKDKAQETETRKQVALEEAEAGKQKAEANA